jgi:prepilin peptidase CpaA
MELAEELQDPLDARGQGDLFTMSVVSWLPLLPVLVAVVYDLRSREVPDWIPLVLLGWALLATALGWHEIGWWELLGGLGLAFACTIVLFALGGLGGGDVKLTTALGANLGAIGFLQCFLCVALAGGLLALVAMIRGKRNLAYVPAIALGLILYLAWRSFHASA